jgi:hypothetical protein
MSHDESTGTERLVARVYASVLGCPAGVHDDFFDLGGHSMLAVLAVGELSEFVGAELPIRLLFDHPTVRGLAAEIDAMNSISDVHRGEHPHRRIWSAQTTF